MLIKPRPFIISSFPSSSSWLREQLPRKNILDMRRFRGKNHRYDGKRVRKPTSASTHREVGTWGLDCIFVFNLSGTYHIVGLCHLEQVDGEAGHMF